MTVISLIRVFTAYLLNTSVALITHTTHVRSYGNTHKKNIYDKLALT